MARWSMRLALTLCWAAALSAAGCGAGDDGEFAARRAPAQPLPADWVAAVDGTAVTRADLRRELAIARKSTSSSVALTQRQLRDKALTKLIRALWIEKEAEARNIAVSDRELERRFAKSSYAKAGPEVVRRFYSGLTKAQVIAGIRATRLEEEINEALTAAGDPHTAHYVSLRWYDKTKCRPGYIVPSCPEAERREPDSS